MRLGVLLALGLLACPVVDAAGDAADARDILREAQAAARAIKAVRYQAHGEADGLLSQQTPRMEGSVILVTIPGAEIPKLRVDAQVVPPRQSQPVLFQLASDGKQVMLAEHGQKVFVQRDLPAGSLLLNNAAAILIRELASERPFAREVQAKTITHLGTETVGDVECDVIHVVYADDSGEARWYFAKADHLPRRVQRIVPTPIGRASITTSLTSLQTNPPIPEDAFQLDKPAGFTDPFASGPPQSHGLLEIGTQAPEWTLKDATGKEVSLKSLRGKLVLLDFWATWCGPCRQAMPFMQKLHDKYKDKPVAVFGVNCYERGPRSDPVGYMKNAGFTYPLLLDASDVAVAYRVIGIPTFYVIGPDGKILMAHSGVSADYERQIEALIDKTLADLAAR